MARNPQLRHLLAAVSTALLLAVPTSALPAAEAAPQLLEHRAVASAAPSAWVTVDPSGHAATITPTVVTSANGAVSTVSPPPSALTSTGTYAIYPTSGGGSDVTVSSGLAPVATAASNAGDGAFFACQVYQGAGAPFCQPKSGSEVLPGKTYYVTWSESYFADASTLIQIQGTYDDGSGEGFSSPHMPASQGYYAWTIEGDFLSSRDPLAESVNVSLTLAFAKDTYDIEVEEVPGPKVIVVNTLFQGGSSKNSGNGPNVVAIAVPVVVVVVFLVLAGLCVWSWRRSGSVPVLGALKRRSTGGLGGGAGYGIRQSAAERVKGGAPQIVVGDVKVGGGVELTDREGWSPTAAGASPPGRNVFREEMQRQETGRQ